MIKYVVVFLFIESVACLAVEEGKKMTSMSTRLKKLRELMIKMDISAYIIPSADDHMSEYLLESDRRREYITGFTGSSGVAVVTENKAALWTDSRYAVDAKRQLDLKYWALLQLANEGVKIHDWLTNHLKKGSRVGVDPRKIDAERYEYNKNHLGKKGIEFVSVIPNLIDEIWDDRPPYPEDIVYVYDIKYAGEKWEKKVDLVKESLNGSALVVSALDEVAWLLNLRGSDFQHTPIFRAFLILNEDNIDLYIPLNKITESVKSHLNSTKYKVNIKDYDTFWDDLVEFGKNAKNITVPTMKPASTTSYQIMYLLPEDKIKKKISPILELKSYKNNVEADGMRRAHVKDSVALCQVMMDINDDVENKNTSVVWDELRVVSELERLRAEQDLNMGSSFSTISAFGPNSALPHYRVTQETNLIINDNGPLTIDSGGQYLDGTIDTTRVVRPGNPSALEINVYTALLKGVIDLAYTVFPEGAISKELEFIARRPLYLIGRDFGHGITHGTGSFLNVHEGFNGTLRENFVGSQEPGYYKENDFGMRLENLIIVVPAQIENHTNKKLLTFEPLTLVPYEKKLIDLQQLEKSEIKWLNDYHKRVRDEVGAEMLKQNKNELYNWLLEQTEPLEQ